jgi:hypothetical protein
MVPAAAATAAAAEATLLGTSLVQETTHKILQSAQANTQHWPSNSAKRLVIASSIVLYHIRKQTTGHPVRLAVRTVLWSGTRWGGRVVVVTVCCSVLLSGTPGGGG